MDSLFAAPLAGLKRAEASFTAAAVTVSEAPAEAENLAEAYVGMVQAKTAYAFSAQSVKVADEMMDVLLSIQHG